MWVKVLLAWLLAALALVAASSDWSQSSSHLYSPLLQDEDWRGKRTGPSLSVANPIEVLRNRLLLEILRRKAQKQGGQVEQNRNF
ncbi:corticotropin-releasing factor family protein, partial [Klebsiella pneumoniae]|uniref:corticotropin-releasing factor family protein n=1 Tax=Klebsiella pneumoniae TaxID=573 RepID=UPI0024DE8CE5